MFLSFILKTNYLSEEKLKSLIIEINFIRQYAFVIPIHIT